MMTQTAKMLEKELKKIKRAFGELYDPNLSSVEKTTVLEELEKSVEVAGLKAFKPLDLTTVSRDHLPPA